MAKKKISPAIPTEPAIAESEPKAEDIGPPGKSDDAGIPKAGMSPVPFKVWTMDELVAEYFPNAKRLSGGVVAGLQRELRRRNRKAEKGY